jgi:hypothetical protein
MIVALEHGHAMLHVNVQHVAILHVNGQHAAIYQNQWNLEN